MPMLDRHGWLSRRAGTAIVPSPNVDPRPAGVQPSLLVIHNISLPAGEFGGPAIEQLFTNRLDARSHPGFAELAGLRVSAHFLIRRDGTVLQFASTDARAWHAGVSRFRHRERCNDFSIGIELEGTDHIAYTDAQYERLAGLTRVLRQRYPLVAACGHEHIAPGRKTDPGPTFDWPRYAREAGWPRRQAGAVSKLFPMVQALVAPSGKHYN
ncbi:MAG: 1,6-anhydro-N-acetylmuramyl-L-alanine amidase AmpD [Pigmentiphaga sp.]